MTAKYELKTKKNDDSVDAFLNGVDDKQKRADAKQITKMMQEVTDQKPVMWGESIIGFGAYHYKYASGQEGDWMAVGFSPRKQNLTLYIMTGFGDNQALLKKLGKYSTGKSCLYIKKLEDIDLDVLKKLIKQSYDHVTTEFDQA